MGDAHQQWAQKLEQAVTNLTHPAFTALTVEGSRQLELAIGRIKAVQASIVDADPSSHHQSGDQYMGDQYDDQHDHLQDTDDDHAAGSTTQAIAQQQAIDAAAAQTAAAAQAATQAAQAAAAQAAAAQAAAAQAAALAAAAGGGVAHAQWSGRGAESRRLDGMTTGPGRRGGTDRTTNTGASHGYGKGLLKPRTRRVVFR